METIRELILQEVRCFGGTQRGNLRPITLLVGENSTGKTTFLGCFRVLHRLLSRRDVDLDECLDFNEEPFSMGSFRDIVRSRRGTAERIDEFKLGFVVAPRNGGSPYEISATFAENGSQPVVSSLCYRFNDESFLELRRGDSDTTTLSIPNHEEETDLPFGMVMLMVDRLTSGDPEGHIHRYPNLLPIVEYLQELFPIPEPAKSKRKGGSRPRFGSPLAGEVIPIAPPHG